MATLLIVWAGLILAVIGCAILNPRPTDAAQDTDDAAGDDTITLPIIWLPFP
jgi:hypothetical protein